ncbi:hypothetical protein [Pseudomonas gingeri]|uniref:Tetratricopeptide repeat protein n=1 Tax=Pseudomonas gingeri TaxID=117681 RepID=A0A7Y7YFL3_9PSED|nr:hypothetical protein [Pseudomonas gingeri]NWB30532.1 hypothetical protein [Pseudomonas gingeri]NWC35612.1 hypothetical protein [Pseudomonas gingeri]
MSSETVKRILVSLLLLMGSCALADQFVDLPVCGDASLYVPPIASPGPAAAPRACPLPTARTYEPRHRGLGYEILMLESQACFVPDESFRLLDSLIDQARDSLAARPNREADWQEQARATFTVLGATLVDNGFQLYVPTETLGDALASRTLAGGGRHIADCDTSAFLYLSVAESLSLPMSMVEMRLPDGESHDYLRWTPGNGPALDWDTNGRAQCRTPSGLPAWQGRSLSRDEVLGYATLLRGESWQKRGDFDKALADYRTGVRLYPLSPKGQNNLAWIIASTAAFKTPALQAEAQAAAQRAVALEPSANGLDTLACVKARSGDFAGALAAEERALVLKPGDPDFAARKHRFTALPAKDCTEL